MKPLAGGLFPRTVCGLGSLHSVFSEEEALCNNPRAFGFPTTAVRELGCRKNIVSFVQFPGHYIKASSLDL